MKTATTIFLFIFSFYHCDGQVTGSTTGNAEQQVENATAINTDAEFEDDSWLQQMEYLKKDPIDLNEAGEAVLKEFPILTAIQIQQLISYRKLCGALLNIYELQAVPGWDIGTIKKIRPFITVSDHNGIGNLLTARAAKGDHSIMIRMSQILERSKGYRPDSAATNFYPGSPQKIFVRYTYHFKNLLQWGLLAEKDAGEQFFKGKQKLGFDFYSAHIFLQNFGNIRSLALGDFTVNLGQGLIQWQGLAFKKSAEVTAIKREGGILKPYHSAGEINFHRGIGITVAKKHWQVTAFASLKKIDANFVSDTIQQQDAYVSSLQTSGYHRTKSEADDKGAQRQLAFGGNITFKRKRLQLGLNGIQYHFGLPVQKSPDPYNRYALYGKALANYSLDYSYTFKNMHFFGEAAVTRDLDKALLGGMIISVSSFADMALLYRNISASYKSLYSNAFTENSSPVNEKGFYIGLTVRPNDVLRIDAYADVFKFPWLKYRVDAPSTGADFLVQADYKPNKQLEIYTRFHSGVKAINSADALSTLSTLAMQPVRDWRTQVNFRINPTVTLRNRTQLVWVGKNEPEQGFLAAFDVICKPFFRSWSGNLRMQYFETSGYDSRLYAYENDVLYSFSIPVFYDKGWRYYVNLNHDPGKNLSIWFRWSQTIYPGKNLIGSGLDEIRGNTRSELRVQALYNF